MLQRISSEQIHISLQLQIEMLVVGLSGGVATGKSTVSSVFRAHGVPIIDADQVARQGQSNLGSLYYLVVNNL